jgi:hypothetical protein
MTAASEDLIDPNVQRSGDVHVRSTTVRGTPSRVDDGIALVRDGILPTLRDRDGCIGLSMLTDRETGRCIVSTSWASGEAMRASARSVDPMRDELVAALGAERAEVQAWAVEVVHRERPAGDGARAQVTWARINPARMESLLDAFRFHLVPRLQQLPGFCSISMMVDRKSGKGVAVTAYEDRDAYARARKEARQLREQFVTAVGAGIADVAEMDLVLAHLHVPEIA